MSDWVPAGRLDAGILIDMLGAVSLSWATCSVKPLVVEPEIDTLLPAVAAVSVKASKRANTYTLS